MGNRSRRAAPHGAYRCRGDDRWCVIAVFTDGHWRGLRQALGDPSWAADERFQTLLGRLAHQEEIDGHLEAWTRQRDPHEVMRTLQAAGVPAGVVAEGRDLVEDPQLRARGSFQAFPHPEIGTAVTRRSPVRYSAADNSVQRGAPLLGPDTEYVLSQVLGLSDEEWVGLLAEGVVSVAE